MWTRRAHPGRTTIDPSTHPGYGVLTALDDLVQSVPVPVS
jgi:hypothetical protein